MVVVIVRAAPAACKELLSRVRGGSRKLFWEGHIVLESPKASRWKGLGRGLPLPHPTRWFGERRRGAVKNMTSPNFGRVVFRPTRPLRLAMGLEGARAPCAPRLDPPLSRVILRRPTKDELYHCPLSPLADPEGQIWPFSCHGFMRHGPLRWHRA